MTWLRLRGLFPLAMVALSGWPARDALAQSSCQKPGGGLVGWWRLDKGSEKRILDATKTNVGTPTGGVESVPGHVDEGLLFDGKTGAIVVADSPSLDLGACPLDVKRTGSGCDLTIEAWIQTSDADGFRAIVDKRAPSSKRPTQGAQRYLTRGYGLFLANGLLAFEMGDENESKDFISDSFVADGKWHHVGVTVERAGRHDGRLYVDGSVVHKFGPRPGALTNGSPLLVGNANQPWPPPAQGRAKQATSASTDGHFHGVIDEVAVYSTALTEKDFATIYDDGKDYVCNVRSLTFGPYDIGVIPDKVEDCPVNQRVVIFMDDQDDANASRTSGWVGATRKEGTGTKFTFCRVDGSVFYNLDHKSITRQLGEPAIGPHDDKAEIGAYTYAALLLGTSCPNGSIVVDQIIDNEDGNNQNWHTPFDISPSWQTRNPSTTSLRFCMFSPFDTSLASMSEFPAIHLLAADGSKYDLSYGVFAGLHTANTSAYLHSQGIFHVVYWQQRGYAYTDDEDWSNGDQTWVNDPYFTQICYSSSLSPWLNQMTAEFGNCMSTHRLFDQGFFWCLGPYDPPNNYFYHAKVWPHGPCTTPCPIGTYDGANCFVATAPPGTTPFIYQGNLYYSPVAGNSCPVAGSFYDGANCFVATPPPGTTPFIYQGSLYYSTVCPP